MTTPAENAATVRKALAYQQGFDVAGWPSHLMDHEIADRLDAALAALLAQAEAAEQRVALSWIDHAIGYATTAEDKQWGDRLGEVLNSARAALTGEGTG